MKVVSRQVKVSWRELWVRMSQVGRSEVIRTRTVDILHHVALEAQDGARDIE